MVSAGDVCSNRTIPVEFKDKIMKRELFLVKIRKHVNGCCPGHDDFPNETYRSSRSKKARARDKKLEHQYARSLIKRKLRKEIMVECVAS